MTKKTPKAKPRKTPIKLVHGKIDLSEWQIDAVERFTNSFDSVMIKAVQEVIEGAMTGDYTGIRWAAASTDAEGRGDEYSSDPKSQKKKLDPLTMYVEIALTSNEENTFWAFNLGDSLREELTALDEDGMNEHGLRRIAAALRSLADEVDAALKKFDAESNG